MASCKPLYRVRVSSSGLIYAVIVGAWAAYLVPMWLRRQDELNEARPTERFSTAIRLLSGRAGMERRYAKELEQRGDPVPGAASRLRDRGTDTPGDDNLDQDAFPVRSGPLQGHGRRDDGARAVDLRAYAAPVTVTHQVPHSAPLPDEQPRGAERSAGPGRKPKEQRKAQRKGRRKPEPEPAAASADAARSAARPNRKAVQDGRRPTADRIRRAKVLARRRRTTMVLFLAFTGGTAVAAVGGLAFLWAPAVPGILLSVYIAYLRAQERRRFAFTMDQRRAEAAARRLREQRLGPGRAVPSRPSPTGPEAAEPAPPASSTRPPLSSAAPSPATSPAAPAVSPEAAEADRRALVEQTDHAEWVADQEREARRGQQDGDGCWEPTPVPLPTYVSAPVAPRNTRSLDLDTPGTWSSARSAPATGRPPAPQSEAAPEPEPEEAPARRRGRSRDRTPLFDQYADEDRPRAANE